MQTTKSQTSAAPAMQGAKHTPGPWKLNYRKHPHFNPVSPIAMIDRGEGSRLEQIAYVCQRNVSGEEKEANAKLIAASPELLESLKCLLLCLEIQGNPLLESRDVKAARAAIAKATL